MLRYSEMAPLLGLSERAVAQRVRRAVRGLWRRSPLLANYRALRGWQWDVRARDE